MKIKFVGENDHMICFVEKTYVYFGKDELVEVADQEAAKLLAQFPGQFEKEEVKAKSAPKTKVLPEVIGDEPSK